MNGPIAIFARVIATIVHQGLLPLVILWCVTVLYEGVACRRAKVEPPGFAPRTEKVATLTLAQRRIVRILGAFWWARTLGIVTVGTTLLFAESVLLASSLPFPWEWDDYLVFYLISLFHVRR